MHMQDALVSPEVALAGFALSLAGLAYAVRKANKGLSLEKVPLMGVMGAFVFAAQMVNFPILIGASGHLIGGGLLAILLGPHVASVTMAGIVVIQCLIFQDGGLLALGLNLWNMALVTPYVSYGVFQLFPRRSRTQVFIAAAMGSGSGVFVSSLFLGLEIGLSQVVTTSMSSFLLLIGGVHILIGLGEGVLTASILFVLGKTYPEVFPLGLEGEKKLSKGAVVLSLFLFALFTASCLSLVASELPDGLEWVVEKMGLATSPHSLAKKAEAIQQWTSLFPDYGLAGSGAKYWTAVAGILGTVLSFLVVCVLGVWMKRKDDHGTL